jgi:hypothetical protein
MAIPEPWAARALWRNACCGNTDRLVVPATQDSTGRDVTGSNSVVDDLRIAFSALASRQAPITGPELDQLKGRVCAVVDELKGAGTLPERIIVAVRGIATESGIRWSDVQMFERVIGWCIERYYDSPHLLD